MNLSTNSFSKNTPTASSNSFADKSVPSSSNSFSKKTLRKGTGGWNGDNLTASEYGFDDLYSGTPFGIGEYGGIRHFQARAKVTVTHLMWFALVLLFVGTVQAADPCPDCPTTMVVDDISMGLQTTLPAYKITGSPNMKNVFIDNGKIEQVGGFVTAGSSMTLQKVTGIFPYHLETGDTKFLVTDSSIVLSTNDYSNWIFVSSGLNTGVPLRCIQVRNKMWCFNGSEPVFTWDDTVKTSLDGTGGTPNVPRFKYGAYWQNRVFGLNTSGDGSSLNWSDVKSTAGAQIAPDHFLAWPSANNLSVGRGDGQVGSGIWVKDGQLWIGKESSIYTIFGTNSSSYFERKTYANVGVNSHDSIVVLDGVTYFAGQDGFYGDQRRITDQIIPDINEIERDTTKTVRNLWDTKTQFVPGEVYGTTTTADGLVTIRSESFYLNTASGSEPLGGQYHTIDSTSPANYEGSLITTETVIPGSRSYPFRFELWGRCRNSACPMEITVRNLRNGDQTVFSRTIPVFSSFSKLDFDYNTNNQNTVEFLKDEIDNSSFSIRVARTQSYTTEVFQFYMATFAAQSTVFMRPATTGQYISDVATINATISAWSNFDSLRNTNGGSFSYFIRTSTSSVNITTQVWNSIVPGVRVNAPTINNYVQWSSTINSVSTFTNTTSIDNVTIDHIEGAGAFDRPFSIDWQNRWWVSVATETSGKFSKIYVKSRVTNPNPNSWMPIEGINIRALAKDSSKTLYGGAASTGVVYRMDYGTNFDGRAIESVYETSDVFLGDPYDEKSVFEYVLFADKGTGRTLSLGTSINGGSFADQSIDLDGSGRAIKLIQNPGGSNVIPKGHYFRWRFKNSVLDKSMSVTNFGVTYKPSRIRKIKE